MKIFCFLCVLALAIALVGVNVSEATANVGGSRMSSFLLGISPNAYYSFDDYPRFNSALTDRTGHGYSATFSGISTGALVLANTDANALEDRAASIQNSAGSLRTPFGTIVLAGSSGGASWSVSLFIKPASLPVSGSTEVVVLQTTGSGCGLGWTLFYRGDGSVGVRLASNLVAGTASGAVVANRWSLVRIGVTNISPSASTIVLSAENAVTASPLFVSKSDWMISSTSCTLDVVNSAVVMGMDEMVIMDRDFTIDQYDTLQYLGAKGSCRMNPCFTGVTCTPIHSRSYTCGTCPSGYTGDGHYCDSTPAYQAKVTCYPTGENTTIPSYCASSCSTRTKCHACSMFFTGLSMIQARTACRQAEINGNVSIVVRLGVQYPWTSISPTKSVTPTRSPTASVSFSQTPTLSPTFSPTLSPTVSASPFSGAVYHMTAFTMPTTSLGGCPYSDISIVWGNYGSMTWSQCVQEASRRGLIMYPNAYTTAGWCAHYNPSNGQGCYNDLSYWPSFQWASASSSLPCILGVHSAYGTLSSRSTSLSNVVTANGMTISYQIYSGVYYDQCLRYASAAGATIMSPWMIGNTSPSNTYHLVSTHHCNTYEWSTTVVTTQGYESLGAYARSSARDCIVGFVSNDYHMTTFANPPSSMGGCTYSDTTILYGSYGSMTWSNCLVEASKRGLIVYPNYYTGVGWGAHYNPSTGLAWYHSDLNNWYTMQFQSPSSLGTCTLGVHSAYTSASSRSTVLTQYATANGLSLRYQIYTGVYYDQCVRYASASGSTILSPWMIGLTYQTSSYHVVSTHHCCTYEYMVAGSTPTSMSNYNVGGGVRSTVNDCIVGYVTLSTTTHLTAFSYPSTVMSQCTYSDIASLRWENAGSMTWMACMQEASRRGMMVYSNVYTVSGWNAHYNPATGMAWNGNSYSSYSWTAITSSSTCALAVHADYSTQSSRSTVLSQTANVNGLPMRYQIYSGVFYDQCVRYASAAGASIISPWVVGITPSTLYHHATVHSCNTYEWSTTVATTLGYETQNNSQRSGTPRDCIVGYVD